MKTLTLTLFLSLVCPTASGANNCRKLEKAYHKARAAFELCDARFSEAQARLHREGHTGEPWARFLEISAECQRLKVTNDAAFDEYQDCNE